MSIPAHARPVETAQNINVIEPRTGTSLVLKKGEVLTVYDLNGEQVSDFLCFNLHDRKEFLSSGRTLDYEETLFLTSGNKLFSNRSNVMCTIIKDEVGRHDFLLTPCSQDTFRIIYGHNHPHHGCFGNLCMALEPYGIEPDQIPVTFNIFMHVSVDGTTGKIKVLPPVSKAGQCIKIRADMDLIVGLTACSAEQSNNGSFKPIGWHVDAA